MLWRDAVGVLEYVMEGCCWCIGICYGGMLLVYWNMLWRDAVGVFFYEYFTLHLNETPWGGGYSNNDCFQNLSQNISIYILYYYIPVLICRGVKRITR